MLSFSESINNVYAVFVCFQVINNACATQAIVSVLLNCSHSDMLLGDTLTEFREFSQSFDAAVCSRYFCLESQRTVVLFWFVWCFVFFQDFACFLLFLIFQLSHFMVSVGNIKIQIIRSKLFIAISPKNPLVLLFPFRGETHYTTLYHIPPFYL